MKTAPNQSLAEKKMPKSAEAGKFQIYLEGQFPSSYL